METEGPTIAGRGVTSMTVTATCSGSVAEFPWCGWRLRILTTTLRSPPGFVRKSCATSAATVIIRATPNLAFVNFTTPHGQAVLAAHLAPSAMAPAEVAHTSLYRSR